MNKQLNWGILGCANIADYRVVPALINEVKNGRLYAIASRNGGARFESMVAKFLPEKAYLSYEALLADPAVDAVYIPLPNALHKEWVIKAANAGKHILCEKPLGLSVQEVQEMAAAADANNVVLMEAFACMHSPLYPTVRQLLADGVIGQVKVVNAFFHCPVPDMPGMIHYSRNLGAGSVYNIGCYNFLSIRELLGREPQKIMAMGELDAGGVDGIDLSHYVTMDMGDGIVAIAQSAQNTAFHRGFDILGTRGFLHFYRTPNAWGTLKIEYTNASGHHVVEVEAPNTYGAEMTQLGQCVLAGEKPLMSLESTLRNTAIYEEVLRQLGLSQFQGHAAV